MLRFESIDRVVFDGLSFIFFFQKKLINFFLNNLFEVKDWETYFFAEMLNELLGFLEFFLERIVPFNEVVVKFSLYLLNSHGNDKGEYFFVLIEKRSRYIGIYG